MREERRTSENVKAFILYIMLIAVMYAPIVFSGKTLQPPLYQPFGIVNGWPYGYSGKIPVNSFNIDSATPAYYEWPVNKLVGNIYKNFELPLWNPYQGAGEPLLAQYSTRVFFPYQIIEDISPVWLWDFFLLGRALVAGFFTYLFLRLLGTGFSAGFLGGILYMFSGAFTWFLTLEQYSNTAMMLPVFMWSIERLLKSGLLAAIAVAALSFGLVILAGQPETALYVLALGALWFCFRTLLQRKDVAVIRRLAQLVAVTLIGLAVAAPLILPFLEFEKQAYHIHPAGSSLGTDKLPGLTNLISIVTPTAHEYPQEPELLLTLPLAKGQTPLFESYYFRTIPLNGVWDFIGGYTGIVPLYLGFAGLLAGLFAGVGKERYRAYLVFFFLSGVVVILKNIGIAPFVWIGHLPLFDRVWSQRWAGPVWIFCFAIAAALACEAFKDDATVGGNAVQARSSKRLLPCLVIGFIALLAVYFLFIPFVFLKFNASYKDFLATFAPSLITATVLTIIFLLSTFAVCAGIQKKGRGIFVLITIASLELWWAMPRGYGYNGLYIKAVPFLFGVLAAFAFYWERKRFAVILSVLFCASFIITDSLATKGLPDRFDAFTPAPYVDFIKKQDGYPRVIGTNGVLFPNFASAIGLYDVRYINSMSIDCFNTYVRSHLANGWTKETLSLWFTGNDERLDVKSPETLSVEDEISNNLPYYSLLGVKYFVMPSGNGAKGIDNEEKPFGKLVYDSEVRIYENALALPHVFVASSVINAPSSSVSQDMAGEPSFDARASAVIEKAPPSWFGGQKARATDARIIAYGVNRVVVTASADAPALAVLSDIYYQGWKAYVDGTPAEIYRVDGLLRGVFIEKGRHTIEFRYLPSSFLAGASIGAIAITLCVGMLFFSYRRKE